MVTAADLPGGKGLIGKISLSFDARKIVFDFRQDPGAGFRDLGSGHRRHGPAAGLLPAPGRGGEGGPVGPRLAHGRRPSVLPAGRRIIFSSTRCEHTVLCGGSSHLVAPGLHRMEPDGTQVEQLTRSPVSEFCPVVLDDGRVMYHRWEYIDKGARVGKTIWSMNPDGSRPQELFGVAETPRPSTCTRKPSPATTHRLVCVGTCHFPARRLRGAILLVDYGKGLRVRGPDPDQPDYVEWGYTRSGDEHHAARVHPAPDRTRLAFPDPGRRVRA